MNESTYVHRCYRNRIPSHPRCVWKHRSFGKLACSDVTPPNVSVTLGTYVCNVKRQGPPARLHAYYHVPALSETLERRADGKGNTACVCLGVKGAIVRSPEP